MELTLRCNPSGQLRFPVHCVQYVGFIFHFSTLLLFQTVEMTLRRNPGGQLGFHVQYEGIISDVETYGFAWQTGLRAGCRLVEVCKIATATLSHEDMVNLLRTSNQVKVVMIPAFPDGNPRRWDLVNWLM